MLTLFIKYVLFTSKNGPVSLQSSTICHTFNCRLIAFTWHETWNTAALHCPGIKAVHPKRDVRGKWPLHEYGLQQTPGQEWQKTILVAKLCNTVIQPTVRNKHL